MSKKHSHILARLGAGPLAARHPALLSALLPALLAACAGGPAPPAWQANAHASLQAFTSAYFDGNTRVAEFEFGRARAELARTGRADLLARAELTRCAARVASLEFDDCPGYRALAADAGAGEKAYAAYLAASWQGMDVGLLPAQHRAVVSAAGDSAGNTAALAANADPAAQLIAAGVLFRAGKLSPAGIAQAVDTASAQGWRRPLLAWLGVQQQRAETAGDKAAAEHIGRWLRRVGGGDSDSTGDASAPGRQDK